MAINGIFNDKTIRALKGGLDGLAARQNVIGNNIANVETPNYKASQVNFEEALQRAVTGTANGSKRPHIILATTHSDHISPANRARQFVPEVTPEPGGDMRNDGNNVDIERQMAMLAETEIRYNALTQLTATKMSGLLRLIREAR